MNSTNQENSNQEKENEWQTLKNHQDFEISSTIPYLIRNKKTHEIIPQYTNNIGLYQINLNNEIFLIHKLIVEQNFNKSFNKQKYEYLENIDLDNCIEIKDYESNKFERYFYDKVNSKIYLQRKSNKKYKVVNPTYNGTMFIISLVNVDGKTVTRSYKKFMKYLKENY